MASSLSAALAAIRPGDRVWIGSAPGTPKTLIRALEEADRPPADLTFVQSLTDGSVIGGQTRFRRETFYVGRELRPLVGGDRALYVPMSTPEAARRIVEGRIPLDVALIQVSPPDADGQVSLGAAVDMNRAAALAARTVIAEINSAMPRTRGDDRLPLARLTHTIEVQAPLPVFLHEPADEIAERIARYVARIVDDGATLHIGLGRIPNEMLKFLGNRRDLGIHSDVVTESILDLLDTGAVNGSRKTLHPGKIVAASAFGSAFLYERLAHDERFEFYPLEYVADPAVIGRQRQMVSVTQAFAIDLTGQVCSDQANGGFYGGVSAQPEFQRGAAAAEGGAAIVCLSSLDDDGSSSRVRARLAEGEGVTLPRADVHFVVTEWGLAYLHGKSIGERALALIEIAHPDHRQHLLEEAKRLGYLGPERMRKSRSFYPVVEERELELLGGRKARLRPSRAADADGIRALFHALRPEDVFTRFFTNLDSLSISRAEHLAAVDYENEMAFVAVTGPREDEHIVGSACYYRDPSTQFADVAYMIHPDWQGCGLGSALQTRLTEYARSHGVRGYTADVLCENGRMLKVFEKLGFPVEKHVASGTYEVRIPFTPA